MKSTVLDVRCLGAVGTLAIDVALCAGDQPTVIVGPNGAGKTTVLRMILGDVVPTRGRVALGDVALFDSAAGVDVPVEQREIGFLPQRFGLFPHLDVLGNVAYGVRSDHKADRQRLAHEALADLGAADLAGRRPQGLSGGEAQRVALARALARRPRALLLDEPLAALDISVRSDVRRFLVEHLGTLRVPTVIVTHDRDDAEAFGGQVVVMEQGAVVQRGFAREIAARGETAFTRRFFGSGEAGS